MSPAMNWILGTLVFTLLFIVPAIVVSRDLRRPPESAPLGDEEGGAARDVLGHGPAVPSPSRGVAPQAQHVVLHQTSES